MRILKYIFLLFFLFLIGLTVFVMTQNASYDVSGTKVIKNPKNTVFNYINDFRNWETFASWIQNDKSIKFDYPELTIGKGATCAWTSDDGVGNLKTYFVKENDSISQKMFKNGKYSSIYWKFEDTIGGTKVTWRSKGKLDFNSKIIAFFKGGINSAVGDSYKKSLENLNKTLEYEINTYAIKINGIVNRPGGFYLKQFMHCKQKDVERYIKVLVPRMERFFEKNKMVKNGKLFIIYHKYDRSHDDVEFSVCMPVRDSIYIMPGSDIQSSKIANYTSLKTTLVGDYSHTQKAWKKAFDYISKNHYDRNKSGQVIEVYVKDRNDSKSPSKWITEIYMPVYPKASEVSANKKEADSIIVVRTKEDNLNP